MIAIVETVLFMLAVLAAVAVAAKRLNIAPSILLVVAGIGMALIPGLPKVTLAPEVVLLVILPPLIYSAGVAMSWRDFKFQPAADRAARLRLRGVHHLRGGGGGALCAGVRLGGRLPARRHHLADRRGGAARHRPPARHPAPPRGGAGGRGARQRRDRAGAVPLRRGRGEHRHVLARAGVHDLRRHRHRRDRLRHRGRLAQPALKAVGARSARRDHAVADDALPRLLGAGASRRLRRAGDGRLRALRELGRAAADRLRHAAAGHLLLGPDRLSDRGLCLPGHRAADAHADRRKHTSSPSAIC